jgi:hypothetical protein
MDQTLTPKQMLCETMYVMFKDNHLPYLELGDFIVMWQSLADKWNVYISDGQWVDFAEEIDNVASNRHQIFTETFEKHF